MATRITGNLGSSSGGTGFRKHTSAEAPLRVCARTPVGAGAGRIAAAVHCKTRRALLGVQVWATGCLLCHGWHVQ